MIECLQTCPRVVCSRLATPCGPMLLVDCGGRLCLADWTVSRHHAAHVARFAALEQGDTPLLREAVRQLRAYFACELTRFSLPLAACGTPFQMQVWQALTELPYGATTTYGALAAGMGRPSAVRAVAAAVGANPLSIVIPCHRVVGADGSLTGYAGTLAAKRHLLALERKK